MLRIRTIKPDFFTSESVLDLSPLARLLFIGLWTEADREGRLRWRPKTWKYRFLPADNCQILDVVDELLAGDKPSIVRYAHGGADYAYIPGFPKHQVINNRETNSTLPPPPDYEPPPPPEEKPKTRGKRRKPKFDPIKHLIEGADDGDKT